MTKNEFEEVYATLTRMSDLANTRWAHRRSMFAADTLPKSSEELRVQERLETLHSELETIRNGLPRQYPRIEYRLISGALDAFRVQLRDDCNLQV